jgi:hypothetical protein
MYVGLSLYESNSTPYTDPAAESYDAMACNLRENLYRCCSRRDELENYSDFGSVSSRVWIEGTGFGSRAGSHAIASTT